MKMMGVVMAMTLASSVSAETPPVVSLSKPNIILVMTDDQGYGDLGCHGHPFLKTPNIDKLHAQATRFTDFHVSPSCAPTRAALMSGKAPFKVGITHTILERERMALSATTMAEVLKSAGYTTGIFGKWHLGDADEYQPQNRGFDEVFIHGGGGIGQRYPGTCADAPKNKYFDPVIKHNGRFVQTEGFCTDIFFDQALGWMKSVQDKKPFFLYLSSNAPHSPMRAPDSYKQPFLDRGLDGRLVGFYGMIANIDDNMGRLMQKLDEWGLSDNALLIFMTDNGTSSGEKVHNAGMKGKKGSPDRGGTRVPLFMRLPGLTKPGVDIDRFTRHYDLFPTFAELAGATVPADYTLDGRSLVPLLKNPEADWSDRNSFVHCGRWNKKGEPGRWGKGDVTPESRKYMNFAVRTERWRLVNKEELYDIRKDPGQQNNVASQHPEVVGTLLAAYEEWWGEVRPLMINEEASLDVEAPYIVQYEKQKAAGGIPKWIKPNLKNPIPYAPPADRSSAEHEIGIERKSE